MGKASSSRPLCMPETLENTMAGFRSMLDGCVSKEADEKYISFPSLSQLLNFPVCEVSSTVSLISGIEGSCTVKIDIAEVRPMLNRYMFEKVQPWSDVTLAVLAL